MDISGAGMYLPGALCGAESRIDGDAALVIASTTAGAFPDVQGSYEHPSLNVSRKSCVIPISPAAPREMIRRCEKQHAHCRRANWYAFSGGPDDAHRQMMVPRGMERILKLDVP